MFIFYVEYSFKQYSIKLCERHFTSYIKVSTSLFSKLVTKIYILVMGNSDKGVVLLDEAFLEEVIFKADVEGWGKMGRC